MVQGRMGRLSVVLFIGLLGAQLTGLSCLEDFPQGVHLSVSSYSYGLVADDTDEVGQSGKDGCPCHLTFAPFTSVPAYAQGPMHPLTVVTPPVWRPWLVSFLFHPPNVP